MAKMHSRQVIAWANKLPLDDLPEAYERNVLKNQVDDSVWYVENDSDESFYVVKWDNYDIADKWTVYVKHLFLHYCGGYVDAYGNIVNNTSSLKTFLGDAKRFFNELNNHFENQYLSELTIANLSVLLRALAIKEDGEPKSRITVGGFQKIISNMQEYYSKGKLSDGFLFDLPHHFADYFYKDFIEGFGIDYAVWYKGGSYGGIPVALAMFILAYALDVIRSDKTKIVLKYFEYLRDGLLTDNVIFGRKDIKGKFKLPLFNIANYPSGKYCYVAQEFVDDINASVSEEYENWFFEDKWTLNKYVGKVYDLGAIAVCILTGYRISELRHVLPSHLDKHKDTGNWTIKSKIIKTNKGIGTVRSFSDEGAEIINILIKLYTEDKFAIDMPVFQRTIRNTTKVDNAVPYNTMLHCFKDGYEYFLKDQGQHHQDVVESLSPHNFRHTWVDMALRCFLPEKDHSILSEEIRHHLRHRYGSTWTRKYMDGKFTPVYMRELEEQYLKDLIERVVGEESDDFMGPTAIRIKNRVKEKIEFIGMDEAIDETVHELCEELIHLEGHPWGLCVLMDDTQTQAKCFDCKSKTPKYEEGSGFETCIGCIHRLSHKSQKEDIIQFVLAHEDFLNNYPINSSLLIPVSQEAVRVGRLIVEEMDK